MCVTLVRIIREPRTTRIIRILVVCCTMFKSMNNVGVQRTYGFYELYGFLQDCNTMSVHGVGEDRRIIRIGMSVRDHRQCLQVGGENRRIIRILRIYIHLSMCITSVRKIRLPYWIGRIIRIIRILGIWLHYVFIMCEIWDRVEDRRIIRI